MSENINCIGCIDNCCKHNDVPVNVYDLAKILYTIKEYEFREARNGFGSIYYNNEEFIRIYYSATMGPQVIIVATCKQLNKDGLCGFHKLVVDSGSNLENLLEKEGYNKQAKPHVCSKHPYFYDCESKQVRKFIYCNQIDYDKTEVIKECKNDLIDEGKKIEDIHLYLNAYFKKTNCYPIVKLALSMINNKKVNAVKSFKKKVEKLFNEK